MLNRGNHNVLSVMAVVMLAGCGSHCDAEGKSEVTVPRPLRISSDSPGIKAGFEQRRTNVSGPAQYAPVHNTGRLIAQTAGVVFPGNEYGDASEKAVYIIPESKHFMF